MTRLFAKSHVDIQRHRHRGDTCDNGDRLQCCICRPVRASVCLQPPQAGMRQERILQACRNAGPGDAFSDFWPPECERTNFCSFKATRFAVVCYSSPGKWIHTQTWTFLPLQSSNIYKWNVSAQIYIHKCVQSTSVFKWVPPEADTETKILVQRFIWAMTGEAWWRKGEVGRRSQVCAEAEVRAGGCWRWSLETLNNTESLQWAPKRWEEWIFTYPFLPLISWWLILEPWTY